MYSMLLPKFNSVVMIINDVPEETFLPGYFGRVVRVQAYDYYAGLVRISSLVRKLLYLKQGAEFR
jgi:hypothetical protein